MSTTPPRFREHADILPQLRICSDEHGRVPGDLGYEGEAGTIRLLPPPHR